MIALLLSWAISSSNATCVPPNDKGVKEIPRLNSYFYDGLPPDRFLSGNKTAIIHFVDQNEINRVCLGGRKPFCGLTIIGCTLTDKKVPEIYLPNPCDMKWSNKEKTYSHYLCHELGHINGWSAKHEP